MAIQFLIRDRDHPDYDPKKTSLPGEYNFPTRLITRKGTMYMLGSEEIELFGMSVLTEAIDRTKEWVAKMERSEKFPKPFYSIQGLGGKKRRWYSGVQLINMHRVAWYKWGNRKNVTISADKFLADLCLVFYQPRIVVDKQGNINV